MKKNGFSLVELLVVVAIIGILSAILVPNVRENLKRAQVASTRSLISSLEMALVTYYQDFGRYPASYDLQGLYIALTQEARTVYEPSADERRLFQQGERYYYDERKTHIGDTLESILQGAGVPSQHLRAREEEFVFVDSWNTPIYYISSDEYNPGRRTDFRQAQNLRFDKPAAYEVRNNRRVRPFKPTSFQLISFGPDGVTIIPSNSNGGIGSMLATDRIDNDGDGFVDLADQVRDPSRLGEPEGTAEDDITNFG